MKISVIMSTYNGEKYIVEQLESILAQTFRPNEVLINDDRSTDGTVEIIENFIKSNHLENLWKISVNKESKGCARNFIEGAMCASGDIIFFSDQDDIWDKEKIELMMEGFQTIHDMTACYCLERYIDKNGVEIRSPLKFTHNVRAKNGSFTKVSFSDNVKYNKCPGLCLAFRKEILNHVGSMILRNKLMHDLPIGNYAAMGGGLYVLSKELVNYRQHGNNLSAPKITIASRIKKIDYQIRGRRGRYAQYKIFYETFNNEMNSKDRKNLYEVVELTKKSVLYLESGNTKALLKQIFINNPMLNRWISINNFLCSAYMRLKVEKE